MAAFELAADRAGMSPDEFAQAVVRDARHQEFSALALTRVRDMAQENRRRALAAAFAAAAHGEDAVLDEEFLFVRALSDLDAPHIRLLFRIRQTRPSPQGTDGEVHGGWTQQDLRAADPGLAAALGPMLTTLTAHDLISAPRTWAEVGGDGSYLVTARGDRMIGRLGGPER